MLELTNTKFKIAIYIRLSKEDADRGYDESESITNQKTLLINYVNKLGENYELVDVYIDPGFTGTNFNRPDFKRMIDDIKLGKINMVMTKDLSRLGRDYIETGEYVEKWFPENNVRYVSVNDGIDTFADNNGNNDIAPFKAILNDMYSKDLSKKIKTALHTMQSQGKWVGSKTALGYQKDPNDKNKLIICEEEAKIVKIIFDLAYNGKSISEITDYLNLNGIPTANKIRYNKLTFWSTRTIKKILTNKVYIGTTIQNKVSRISYKNRKLRSNPKEQWQIVENTHEAIINKKQFNFVQSMKITQSYMRNEKKNNVLLDGLMICYECKHKIGIKKEKNGKFTMLCSNYRRFSKLGVCTAHGFSYNKLEESVLNSIRNLFVSIDEEKIALNINNINNKCDYEKYQDKIKKELNSLTNNLDKMYLDKLNQNITEEMYQRLSKKLQDTIRIKKEELQEIESKKNELSENNQREIKLKIKEYLKLENPTSEILKILINRIEIHKDKQVDIIFNFKELNILSRSN